MVLTNYGRVRNMWVKVSGLRRNWEWTKADLPKRWEAARMAMRRRENLRLENQN